MQRKPRSDSKLASLPSKQREELDRWLVEENESVADVKERLLKEFEVETSAGAISGYFRKHCSIKRIDYARRLADQLGDVDDSQDLEGLALINLRQAFFQMAASPDLDVDDLNTLGRILGDSHKLRLKEKQIDLAERRVAILEKKAAAYDEAEGILSSKLTEEEKGLQMRQLFGM